jgi:hypothetical protein
MSAQVEFHVRTPERDIRQISPAVRHPQGLHDAAVVEDANRATGGVGYFVNPNFRAVRHAAEGLPCDHARSIATVARPAIPSTLASLAGGG